MLGPKVRQELEWNRCCEQAPSVDFWALSGSSLEDKNKGRQDEALRVVLEEGAGQIDYKRKK